jgi:4-hydroxybenzoate polyprenyltransferase
MAIVPLRGWAAVRTFLEMIKIEHSIFALPFAMIGMMWGSLVAFGSAWPGGAVFGWIVVAMVSCRSAAMAYNRIADRDIDADNPRTKMRPIPAGLLSLRQSNLFFLVACVVFFVAAWQLNWLSLFLAPVALGVTLFYSQTKRFTWLCHYVLGLSLGIAPAASFIAVTGRLDANIVWLTAAVTLWTAGFDVIYSLQDEEFDRSRGLHSLPARFGRERSLLISRLSHGGAVVCLFMAGLAFGRGALYFVGVLVVASILIYEQSLVKPNDLSRVNLAFFTLNGWVSIGLFVFTILDIHFVI